MLKVENEMRGAEVPFFWICYKGENCYWDTNHLLKYKIHTLESHSPVKLSGLDFSISSIIFFS